MNPNFHNVHLDSHLEFKYIACLDVFKFTNLNSFILTLFYLKALVLKTFEETWTKDHDLNVYQKHTNAKNLYWNLHIPEHKTFIIPLVAREIVQIDHPHIAEKPNRISYGCDKTKN